MSNTALPDGGVSVSETGIADPVPVRNTPPLCEECGSPIFSRSGRARFCTPKCRYKARDRERYSTDSAAIKARVRAWYAENREYALDRAASKRRSQRPRRCECGELTWSPKSPYCRECSRKAWERLSTRRRISRQTPEQLTRLRERERKRVRTRSGTTTTRGYGAHHQKLRRHWRREVDAGLAFCTRCGALIEPGEPWDLGHDDHDRSVYNGPEHRRCNRATSGRTRKGSRQW
jgi:hypothetical protein